MSKNQLQSTSDSSSDSNFQKIVAAFKKVVSDINRVQYIVTTSLFGTDIYKLTEYNSKNVSRIASQADKGILGLEEVVLMTKEIKNLALLTAEAKSHNPLIPDQLTTALNTTVTSANQALEVTRKVLE